MESGEWGGASRWTVALRPGELGGRSGCNIDCKTVSKGDRWGGGRKWFREKKKDPENGCNR